MRPIKEEPNDIDIQKAALYDCLRPEIRKMAHQMEQKFRLHDDERGDPFKPLDLDWLQQRFNREQEELLIAMGKVTQPGLPEGGKRPSDVWREAADCCNFLTMMAVNYEREYYQRKREIRV